MNVGLHNHKSAQEYQQVGKFILKAPVYRPKIDIKYSNNVVVAKLTERVVYINKVYLNHYSF